MDKNSSTIRVIIADDHPIFRIGLRKFLESQPDVRVIAEATDGDEAVRLSQRLKPEILLLDLSMPVHGMETLREIGNAPGGPRIIVLTASVEKPQIVEAFQLGARGIVMKEAATQVLLNSIREVMKGRYWVHRESRGSLVECLRALMPAAGKARQDTYGLTPREREIVSAIVLGNTNKDIARTLSISEDTVKHHLTSVFNKLGVANRLELALFAINRGLVESL